MELAKCTLASYLSNLLSVENNDFLLIVDAYSKWPEIFKVNSISSETLIKFFKKIFTTFGYVKHLVTDNGTQYASDEFKTFTKSCGINIHFLR